MRTNRETPLCRYYYDALDRLAVCTPAEQSSTGRYYQKSRLATEIQGLVQHSIFQYDDQLLAQHQRQGGTVATTLLITDQQRSALNALDATPPRSRAYTPYGHRPVGNGLLSLLSFNGERPDPVTGHFHLGNGYRQFNPVLMRFNSPDSWSPFGKGGINAYAYCAGDPINRSDPTGHLVGAVLRSVADEGVIGADVVGGFRWALNQVKIKRGGTKAVRLKAIDAGMHADDYLFNKAVKLMANESVDIISFEKAAINTATDIDSLILNHVSYAEKIKNYEKIAPNILKLEDFLTERNRELVRLWYKKIQEWGKDVHLTTRNRIRLAQPLNPESPPPYSRLAPPPPYTDAARDNIRETKRPHD